MKRIFSLLLPLCLSGCLVPYSYNTYKYSSPMHRFVGRYPPDAEIRAAILAIIPLGTPYPDVKVAIRANFSVKLEEGRGFISQGAGRDKFFIRITLHKHQAFILGDDETTATFIFDNARRLQTLLVFKNMDYL